MAEINVTPFVDVMLVLLIVFMITAPLLTTGVNVDLPRAKSSPLPGQDEPLAVTLAADGTIYLQDSAVALDALAARLAAITGENRETRIFVRGDRSIDYGRVMAVVSAINRAGFTRVALVTEAPAGAAAAPPAGRMRADAGGPAAGPER
ncbi:MAG TPA: protein TolR [Rhodospirillales bacterium]|nr:protein TolR [Rhodospirillales bacterium]